MSVTFNPVTKFICVHGKEEVDNGCVCDPGWTTQINQNPLLGPIVYCNETNYSTPPGGGRLNPVFVVIIVVAVFLAIFLMALTAIRYLWEKKREVKMGPLSHTQSYHIARLIGYLNAAQRVDPQGVEHRNDE